MTVHQQTQLTWSPLEDYFWSQQPEWLLRTEKVKDQRLLESAVSGAFLPKLQGALLLQLTSPDESQAGTVLGTC